MRNNHSLICAGGSVPLIDGAIDQWSKRITMVIQAQGSHIEH